MTLAERIDQLVEQHGSLRAVARMTGIEVSYLSRLRAGEKVNPLKDTLRRLGLRRVVTYEPTDHQRVAPPPSAPCPHIRSSGVGDHATHWCALNGPPSVPEPSEAEVEAAWRAIPASHEDSRVSVITKGDVWVMLRAAAAARGK